MIPTGEVGPTLVLAVTGPTAGGKSDLANRLAARLGVPIVSLDSMKIYRGMDLGTAKPPPEVRRAVPYHLMDIRDPWESFSVADFISELRALAPHLGPLWLLSGGTPFYLHALLAGLFEGPGAQPEVRLRLHEEAQRHGPSELHRRLAGLDPTAAAALHPEDLRRVVRALEVIESTGERFSVLQARRRPVLPPDRVRRIGIARARQDLYARIDQRVERMFRAGWVGEVESLLAAHDPPWSEQAAQSIGYVEIAEALRRGESPTGRIERIQRRSHRLARSQLTWCRRLGLEWWAPQEGDALLDALESLWESVRSGAPVPPADPSRTLPAHA